MKYLIPGLFFGKKDMSLDLLKKGSDLHFEYKLHSIICRDYELIRIFKTKIASLYDSQVDSSEKNEVVYRDRGYFEATSKGYDSTMKRTVKEQTM